MTRSPLFTGSLILLGLLLITASIDHRGYLELCVCVVNALSRAIIALGVSIFFGLCTIGVEIFSTRPSSAYKVLGLLQLIGLTASLFFIVQYVLFLLEVVS